MYIAPAAVGANVGVAPSLNIDKSTTSFYLSGGQLWLATLTPPQITGPQDDWNPTGLAGAVILFVTSDAARIINGMQGGTDGRVIWFANIGSFIVRLGHQIGTSGAANRFTCPNLVNYDIINGGGVMVAYDGTNSRWRVVGPVA